MHIRKFHTRCCTSMIVVGLLFCARTAVSQSGGTLPDSMKAKRWAIENELQTLAVISRKVMIPMRDGIRIPADIYYPKSASSKYPAIWVRTPYNFNYWDVANGVPRDMTSALTAVKRGYAYIDMQERGHFFAEGNYDILGAPLSDGDDELKYLSAQSWSNGKVTRKSGFCRHERARLWRRRRQSWSVQRNG